MLAIYNITIINMWSKKGFLCRFRWSGLSSMFHSKVHFQINESSLAISLALSFLSSTMLKIDVSSANSFALFFNSFGKSSVCMRKRRFVRLKQLFEICLEDNFQLLQNLCEIPLKPNLQSSL